MTRSLDEEAGPLHEEAGVTGPTPIALPSALAGLAAHDPAAIVALRAMREDLEARSTLDERTIELVRIGALVALAAPDDALAAHVQRLQALGVPAADVWSALTAVAPLVGVPALVRATPVLTAVLDRSGVS